MAGAVNMAAARTSLPETMKAWQYGNGRGGLANLRLNNAATPPKPPPSGSQKVLIEVISMALNPADYKVPEVALLPFNLLQRLLIPKPASPGLDFCGRVISCADGMKEDPDHEPLQQGQLVFGRHDFPYQFGTLGQFIVAPRSGIAPLPSEIDVDSAAAIGTGALSAYQSLAPYVKEGSWVFINGGSGGVGIFTIQLAKILGCFIVVSCSTANMELCRNLGANEVIDYTACDITETLKSKGKVFDLVVDNVSKPYDLYKGADHFLKRNAHFIQVGAADDSLRGVGSMLSRGLLPSFLGGGQHPWRFLQVKNSFEDLVRIGKWVREGKIKVQIDSVFEFQDAPEAIKKLRTGRAKGKIVVHVTERP